MQAYTRGTSPSPVHAFIVENYEPIPLALRDQKEHYLNKYQQCSAGVSREEVRRDFIKWMFHNCEGLFTDAQLSGLLYNLPHYFKNAFHEVYPNFGIVKYFRPYRGKTKSPEDGEKEKLAPRPVLFYNVRLKENATVKKMQVAPVTIEVEGGQDEN